MSESVAFFYVLGVFSSYLFALAGLMLVIYAGITMYERKSGHSIVNLFMGEEAIDHVDKE